MTKVKCFKGRKMFFVSQKISNLYWKKPAMVFYYVYSVVQLPMYAFYNHINVFYDKNIKNPQQKFDTIAFFKQTYSVVP